MPGRQCPPAMSGVCWTSVSGSCHWVQVRPWEGPLGLTRTLPEGTGSVPHGPAETSWHGGQQLGMGAPTEVLTHWGWRSFPWGGAF